MSKRKTNQSRPNQPRPNQLQPKILSKEELLSPEAMSAVQAAHFKFLESWGASMPKLHGVSIPLVLDYEVIQILNDVYLRAVLA